MRTAREVAAPEHGHRVRGPDRRQHVHAARPASRGVRRDGPAEPLRRHRLHGLAARPDRSLGRCPRRQLRRSGRGLRADPRLGAEVRGQERGQPDRAAPLRDADAPTTSGEHDAADRLEARDRGADPRGQERHLRHEAGARRPDRRRDERRRGRADRQLSDEAQTQDSKVAGRVGSVGATCAPGAHAMHDATPTSCSSTSGKGLPRGKALDVEPDGAAARPAAERRRLKRVRRLRGLGSS